MLLRKGDVTGGRLGALCNGGGVVSGSGGDDVGGGTRVDREVERRHGDVLRSCDVGDVSRDRLRL